MHYCQSGNHAWIGAHDAARCCNPDWRRILVSSAWGDKWQDGDKPSAVGGLRYRWVSVSLTRPAPGSSTRSMR